MIIDKLTTKEVKTDFLPKTIMKILELLKKINFNELENKKYEIVKDEIFLVINEYQTKKPEEKKAEQHKIYIDIQYIISGKENIGMGYENEENEILDNYDLNKDRISFKKVKNETLFPLKEDSYIIIFPNEIHRPELHLEGEQKVKKAVIKINKNMLNKREIGELNLKWKNQT